MNLSVLVCSSDSNADLWPIFFEAWFLNSPFKDFKIYLSSETLRVDDNRVQTLMISKCGINNWSTRLVESLDYISSKYTLLLTDDLIFINDLNYNKFNKIEEYINLNRVDMLRLVAKPPPPKRIFNRELFDKLPSWALYRVSLQASIWNTEILRKITIPNETPWKFELEGTKRSISYDHFYSARSDLVRYVEIISAGKITKQGRNAIKSLNSSKFLVRNKTTFNEEVFRLYTSLKFKFFYSMPFSVQKILIENRLIGRDFRISK